MPDDDPTRPSLQPPQIFGRRRSAPVVEEPVVEEPVVEEPVFEDAGREADSDVTADEATDRASPPRPRRDRSVPLLPGRIAAMVTGVIAGLSLVGFTWVGARGCEALSGTSSCGAAPGMLALLLVLVLAVTVGGVVLSFFKVPDPGATSALGIGLTAVICLVFLVDQLEHWSMVIVIPVICVGTYVGAWLVTTTAVDTD